MQLASLQHTGLVGGLAGDAHCRLRSVTVSARGDGFDTATPVRVLRNDCVVLEACLERVCHPHPSCSPDWHAYTARFPSSSSSSSCFWPGDRVRWAVDAVPDRDDETPETVVASARPVACSDERPCTVDALAAHRHVCHSGGNGAYLFSLPTEAQYTIAHAPQYEGTRFAVEWCVVVDEDHVHAETSPSSPLPAVSWFWSKCDNHPVNHIGFRAGLEARPGRLVLHVEYRSTSAPLDPYPMRTASFAFDVCRVVGQHRFAVDVCGSFLRGWLLGDKDDGALEEAVLHEGVVVTDFNGQFRNCTAMHVDATRVRALAWHTVCLSTEPVCVNAPPAFPAVQIRGSWRFSSGGPLFIADGAVKERPVFAVYGTPGVYPLDVEARVRGDPARPCPDPERPGVWIFNEHLGEPPVVDASPDLDSPPPLDLSLLRNYWLLSHRRALAQPHVSVCVTVRFPVLVDSGVSVVWSKGFAERRPGGVRLVLQRDVSTGEYFAGVETRSARAVVLAGVRARQWYTFHVVIRPQAVEAREGASPGVCLCCRDEGGWTDNDAPLTVGAERQMDSDEATGYTSMELETVRVQVLRHVYNNDTVAAALEFVPCCCDRRE